MPRKVTLTSPAALSAVPAWTAAHGPRKPMRWLLHRVLDVSPITVAAEVFFKTPAGFELASNGVYEPFAFVAAVFDDWPSLR